MKNNFSVIIPTLNRHNSLRNTINSFLNGSVVPNEIIIIDQSDSPDSIKQNKDLVKEFSSHKCEIVYEYQPIPSSTHARNIGLSLAKYNLIIFSDDDIEVNFNTLENVSSIMNDETISMIAGINEMEPTSNKFFSYFLGFKSFWKRNKGHIAPAVLGKFPKNIKGLTETEWAMGFFFVVRRQLIQMWNLAWDEKLTGYAYAEDLDFSFSYYKNSRQNKMKCIISKNVFVRHLVSSEYRIPSRKTVFKYVLNRAYLLKKHKFGLKYRFYFTVSNFALLIGKYLKKENPKDMLDAIKFLKKHKNSIEKGVFNYE